MSNVVLHFSNLPCTTYCFYFLLMFRNVLKLFLNVVLVSGCVKVNKNKTILKQYFTEYTEDVTYLYKWPYKDSARKMQIPMRLCWTKYLNSKKYKKYYKYLGLHLRYFLRNKSKYQNLNIKIYFVWIWKVFTNKNLICTTIKVLF